MKFDNLYWILFSVFVILVELFIRYHITSSKKYKRWRGCWVAIFAQVLWVIIFLTTHQYVLIVLTVVDAVIWTRGVHRNWPKKRRRGK